MIAYKAADPPDTVDAAIRASEAFLQEVRGRLGESQPLLAHPHWLGGVGEWRASREDRGVWRDPPELSHTPDVRRRAPAANSGRGLRRLARGVLVGEPGRRGLGHPYWIIQRALNAEVASLGERTIAMIGPAVLERFVRPVEHGAEPSAALVGIDLSSPERVTSTLDEIGALPAGAELRLVVVNSAREAIDGPNLAGILASVDALASPTRAAFFDLSFDRKVELIHGALADATPQVRPMARTLLLVRAFVALVRMTGVNLRRAFGSPPSPRAPVTTVVLAARRRE